MTYEVGLVFITYLVKGDGGCDVRFSESHIAGDGGIAETGSAGECIAGKKA